MKYLQSNGLFQILMYLLLMLAFAIQVNVIFPLERSLLAPATVDIVSLLFIPFGFKVIFAAFGGAIAILPIFFAHLTIDLFLDRPMDEVLIHSFSGVFVVFLPLVLMNYARERALFARLDLSNDNLNIFRVVLVLAFTATILNSVIHSTIYQGLQIDLLAFRYVIGDMGGTLVVLLSLLLARRSLIRLSHRMIR